jgi:hypothetical protein
MSDGKKVVKVNPSYLKVTEQSGLEDEPKKRTRRTLKSRRMPKALKEETQNTAMENIQSNKLDAIKEKIKQQIEERTRKIRDEIMKKKERLDKIITTAAKEDAHQPSLTLKTFHDVFNTEDEIQLMDEEEKKMERPRLSGDIVKPVEKKELVQKKSTLIKEEPVQKKSTLIKEEPVQKKSTLIKEEPAYGILKGGTKPTYSEFRKTQKHHSEVSHNRTVRHIEPPKDWIEKDWKEMTKRNTEINGKKMKLTIGEDVSDDEFMGGVPKLDEKREEERTDIEKPVETTTEESEKIPVSPFEEKPDEVKEVVSFEPKREEEQNELVLNMEEPVSREEKLKDFKERFSTPSSLPSLRRQRIKTLKKSFLLGKYKVRKDGEDIAGHRIGVLIKNNKTRRYIKEHLHILEKTSMSQIRKYLKQRNMIRAGAEAPDFLLRKLFIDLLSSGEVYNRNGELLLHNFIVDEEEPEKLTLKDEGNLQLDVVLL